MKVLCICEHGNVRSVALAYLIKTIYGHEAIAVGVKNISAHTDLMLTEWADKIIYLDGNIEIDKGHKVKDVITHPNEKTIILDVGEDIWHDPFHHNLQHKLLKKLKSLEL